MAYDLQRFVDAQDADGSFEHALAELRRGRKVTHWIWWVFPQLVGLGASPTSRYYGIASLDEAREFAAHPVLGVRLREAVSAMTQHVGSSAVSILGGDDVKFRSSMTLFTRAVPGDGLFRSALEQFFAEPDARTDELLAR